MTTLFSSEQFRLQPQPAPHFREELLISSSDARRLGVSDAGQFGILAIEPLHPGPPDKQFAVRVVPEASAETGSVRINQNFLDGIGFRPGDDRLWSVKSAPTLTAVTEAVIELVVEQSNVSREVEALRREQRDLFLNRCLLVEPGCQVGDLSLPVMGRGYFNFRAVQPPLETFRSSTVLVLNENTTLNLFVPHRRSGVDMVIVVDGSGSMDLCDYVGSDNHPHARLEGVRVALEALFQRRLAAGSRVSRIAAVVFGGNTQMLYPSQEIAMAELRSAAQVDDIRASTRDLSLIGLQRLKVDRGHTNISQALQYAAELLNYYSQEGNERMMVLLSDGAHWSEDTESKSDGEIVTTADDPAVLADSLNYDSQVRIHTVAISDEPTFKRHISREHWNVGWIPNTALLRKIADVTDGLSIESPDAPSLVRLFDELGEGALYPV